jgi:hypothetical protein
LDGLYSNFIGEVKANWLKRAIDEDEVFEVVKALNNDKSLSLTAILLDLAQNQRYARDSSL